MPPTSPSTSLATLRPDLAGSVMEFNLASNRAGYIGLQILPVLEVGESGGSFGRIPIEQLLQRSKTQRAPGSAYSRGSWKFEPDSYSTIEQGHEEPIDENTVRMYRNYFDAEQICAQRAYNFVLQEQEIRVAELLCDTDTFSPTDVTNEWDDKENATPIDDVEASVRRVWAACGMWPNALIINRQVFRNLRNCEQVLDRIQSQGAGDRTLAKDVTAAMLASVFDLSRIIIAGSAYNTADEGQDVAISSVWSNEYAMVARVAETNDIQEPCLGRTMHWDEDGSEIGGTFETYREEQIRGDVVRVRHQVGEKLIYTEAADLLSNVTTIAEEEE